MFGYDLVISDNSQQEDLINNGVLPASFTFTRASSATYLDINSIVQTASTNVARREWNSTASKYAYKHEGARTNLLLQSEAFDDNAYWNAATNATITANDGTAPDGNTTADRLTADSSVTGQRREQTITVTASTTKILTVYIKAGTQNTGQARLIATGSASYTLNITPTRS